MRHLFLILIPQPVLLVQKTHVQFIQAYVTGIMSRFQRKVIVNQLF
jgi:hypothetical protein